MDPIFAAYRKAGASPASLAYWEKLLTAAAGGPSAADPAEGEHTTALLSVLRKLTRLSERLSEMEAWLEMNGGQDGPRRSEHGADAAAAVSPRLPITLGNLGQHIARETRA
jgi:hypothetical protein